MRRVPYQLFSIDFEYVAARIITLAACRAKQLGAGGHYAISGLGGQVARVFEAGELASCFPAVGKYIHEAWIMIRPRFMSGNWSWRGSIFFMPSVSECEGSDERYNQIPDDHIDRLCHKNQILRPVNLIRKKKLFCKAWEAPARTAGDGWWDWITVTEYYFVQARRSDLLKTVESTVSPTRLLPSFKFVQ